MDSPRPRHRNGPIAEDGPGGVALDEAVGPGLAFGWCCWRCRRCGGRPLTVAVVVVIVTTIVGIARPGGGADAVATGAGAANANIDAVGCTETWTQGTALCKKIDTHEPMVNLAGADYAAQATACGVAGGKVTDFFLYKADGSGAADKKKLTIEVIQKMAVYTNAWLYTIHEFEDAVADCKAATLYDNDEGVHAWDEGVAFYTGSEAGAAGHYTPAGATDGVMLYALANKRCKNFKTCGVGEYSGNSAVNIALFDQFALGKNACQVGDCPTVLPSWYRFGAGGGARAGSCDCERRTRGGVMNARRH